MTITMLTGMYALLLTAKNAHRYTFGAEVSGRKYLRVWQRHGGQDSRSVLCFVDRATGELRHGDGWKKAGRSMGASVADVVESFAREVA